MREKWSRRGLIAFACFALSISTSRTSAWDGSDAADGHCCCSGTLDPALARRTVPTPVGDRSIAAVCERIGTVPGLPVSNEHPERVTYADPQYGNGPSSNGSPTPVRTGGGSAPGCWLPGPRWNLEAVHSRRVRESVAEAIRQLDRPGTIGAVAAPPVLAGAVPEPRAAVVPGRQAMAPRLTGDAGAGRPGSHFVLDGHVCPGGEGASGTADAGTPAVSIEIGTVSGTDITKPKAERAIEVSVFAPTTHRQALTAEARALVRARQGRRAGSANQAH